MTTDDSHRALELTRGGEFAEAGDCYTQAAYDALAHDGITTGNEHQIGDGLDALLRAALSYRRAGVPDRCVNRCEQGILIASDLRSYVVDDDRKRAVLQEYVADFRGLGGMEEADRAYQETLDLLAEADVEYSTSLHTSPIADRIIGFTMYVSQWAETELSDELEVQYDFASRVRFKRDEMAGIIRSLES